MSFKSGEIIIKGRNTQGEKVDPNQDLPSLSKEQIMFLLKIIQQHDFKGKDIEILYNTTLNLQKQYIYLNNK
jgi:hypothetical protein|tara:strand:+ start:2110 stop:2325 length:216 start_codon:yes stop_codon:yes gene_type:complete